MRSRVLGIHVLVVTMTCATALGVSTAGATGLEKRPTPTQLDAGLLESADVLPIFQETDRRTLDAADLADDKRGPCNGPNTMAHAVALDEQVDVVTAAFGTEAGASLTEDVFSFKTAKQAASFIKKNSKQLKTCDTWDGVLGGVTREFEVTSTDAPKLGDQALEVNVIVAPLTPSSTGFDGELIRETTYVRVGSVVVSLLYLRSVDFPARPPGAGYPQSAVTKIEDAI